MFIIPKNSEGLLKTPEYQFIRQITEKFIQTSNPAAFSGNCVANSDILQTLFSRHGITSRIVECQAAIFKIEPEGRVNYMFVGYDNYSYPGQIDTHTVVITEGEIPLLIDLSLGYVLPNNKKFLITSAAVDNPSTDKVICELKFDDYEIIYYEKTNIRLPNIHQKNLMQRLIVDQEQAQILERQGKEINMIRWIVTASVGMAVVNFVALCVILFLKIVYHT